MKRRVISSKPIQRQRPLISAKMIRDRTLRYYRLIDLRQLPQVFALFSRAIFYERGPLKIKGIVQFRNFYNNLRKLKGKHQILKIQIIGNQAIVEGRFRGTIQNKQVGFLFTDYLWFKKNGLIRKRKTILHDFKE